MSRRARIPIPLFNQPKPAGFDSNDGFSSHHGLALTLSLTLAPLGFSLSL
jgi:hypothetical protein